MNERLEYQSQPDLAGVIQAFGANRRSRSALAKLSRQFDEACTTAVDSLQIAAALESGGITDQIARSEYGLPDVFAVAEELFLRVPRRIKSQAKGQSFTKRWQNLRELSHGLLYALTGLAYPAMVGTLGDTALFIALVMGTAVSWSWSMGVSWLAYRLIGRGAKQEAARVLLRGSLIGILGVQLIALLVAKMLGLGPAVMVFAMAQMAYQMAASVLIIYGLEGWLFFALLPSLVVNGWYLLTTSPNLQTAAISATLTSITLALNLAFLALWNTPKTKIFWATLSLREIREVLPIFAYGALSAALVLLGNAHNMFASPDLSLSIVPLVLSMGILEWQARRFNERSRGLLHDSHRVSEFVSGVRWALVDSLTTSVLMVAFISSLTAFALSQFGLLSLPGAIMLTAHILLAGTFFVNFILLAHGRHIWVLGSLCAAVIVLLVLSGFFLSASLSYLAATTLLLILVTLGLMPSLGQVAHYQ